MLESPNLKRKRTLQILYIGVVLSLGFLTRVLLSKYFIKESGDIRLYADWAEKFWMYGPKDFYTHREWYYAPPNYPPLLSLIYAGAYYLYDHKYYLPQLHNLIKIPPAAFIIYFYEHGLYLLLKIPGIVGDLGLTLLIYKVVQRLTGSVNKAIAAGFFYLFNPVSIFLSGVWGQTDALVALLGFSSFMALWGGQVWLSIPLLFTSFYIKPNWGIFIPLYLYLVILKKPNIKHIFSGIVASLIIFWSTTKPFTETNIFSFSKWLLSERLLPTASVAHKVSVSAFNFHTVFFTFDGSSDTSAYLGVPARFLGYLLYFVVNIYIFNYIHKSKVSLYSLVFGIFSIGFASYLFLTNMLERYFFAAFTPLIILMFSRPKLFIYGVLINIAVFANVFYAFFRRSKQGLAELFAAENFFLVRFFSVINVLSFFLFLRSNGFRLKEPFLLKLKRG